MSVNRISPINKNYLTIWNRLSKIPDVLIYSKTPNKKIMVNTKKGSIIGEMYIEPRQNFAYIAELFINPKERGKGYGNRFLDYAQDYSRENGCNGNLGVMAGAMGNESKSPHIFYRKYGFTSPDTKRIAEIDSYIKKNQTLPDLYPHMNLYFEPNKK